MPSDLGGTITQQIQSVVQSDVALSDEETLDKITRLAAADVSGASGGGGPRGAAKSLEAKRPMGKRIEKLNKALQEGLKDPSSITSKHKLNQYMLSELDEVEKEEWDAITGKGKSDKQAAWREKWMIKKKKSIDKEYFHDTSFETVDVSKGQMLPLPRIIQKEGGGKNPENVKAALTYIFKCIIMGGEWLWVNPMTERVELFYVRRSRIEMFKNKWHERVNYSSSSSSSRMESLSV